MAHAGQPGGRLAIPLLQLPAAAPRRSASKRSVWLVRPRCGAAGPGRKPAFCDWPIPAANVSAGCLGGSARGLQQASASHRCRRPISTASALGCEAFRPPGLACKHGSSHPSARAQRMPIHQRLPLLAAMSPASPGCAYDVRLTGLRATTRPAATNWWARELLFGSSPFLAIGSLSVRRSLAGAVSTYQASHGA